MSSKAQTREKDYERGIRIADRRKEIGLSQDELAHRVGTVSYTHLKILCKALPDWKAEKEAIQSGMEV